MSSQEKVHPTRCDFAIVNQVGIEATIVNFLPQLKIGVVVHRSRDIVHFQSGDAGVFGHHFLKVVQAAGANCPVYHGGRVIGHMKDSISILNRTGDVT